MDDLCGCKGARFCAACRTSERVKNLRIAPENTNDKFSDHKCYVFENGQAFYCPDLSYESTTEEILQSYTNKETDSCFVLPGINLIENFLDEKEEEELVQRIDNTNWCLSQSGRRKQVSSNAFSHENCFYGIFNEKI